MGTGVHRANGSAPRKHKKLGLKNISFRLEGSRHEAAAIALQQRAVKGPVSYEWIPPTIEQEILTPRRFPRKTILDAVRRVLW